MAESINPKAAAELADISTRQLERLRQSEDPPPKDANGHYLAREFGRWLKRRNLSGLSISPDGIALDLDAERARLAKEQADKTAMENAVRRGDLVSSELVADWWSHVITNAKTRLLGIPTAAAPLVLGTKSLAGVRDKLEELITDALNDLSRTNPIPGAGSDADMAPAAAPDGEPVGGPVSKAKSRGKRRTRTVANG